MSKKQECQVSEKVGAMITKTGPKNNNKKYT
jgi:hypothetical protein